MVSQVQYRVKYSEIINLFFSCAVGTDHIGSLFLNSYSGCLVKVLVPIQWKNIYTEQKKIVAQCCHDGR